MDKKYFSTFRFRNTLGRKVGIFGRRIGDVVEVVVLPSYGRIETTKMYLNYPNCGGTTYCIGYTGDPKKAMLEWCGKRFKKIVK